MQELGLLRIVSDGDEADLAELGERSDQVKDDPSLG
jgi:hypothetical protein